MAMAACGEPVTVKVKDVVRVKGANANPLMGYGLVIGLPNTGDSQSALQTERMAANMLRAAGIRLDDQKLRMRNVAAVMVTASLPAYAQAGDDLDILVSSIGDARSLRGGTLLMTRLEAADGTCYAVAQGPLSTGSGTALGLARAREGVASGRVPGGALVLHDSSAQTARDGRMTLVLEHADYATAERLKEIVGAHGASARVVNPAAVEVTVGSGGEAALMAAIGDVALQTDAPATVVFNERTGTIVMGGDVRLSPVAVSHGSLKVQVAAGAGGVQAAFGAPSGSRPMSLVRSGGATLQDLVDALNDLGATPAEMMQVLQALKQAGALKARLEIQ
jgi:flagellar P-ring protein precursor FlgI